MSLPPLANLFAFSHRDPAALAAVAGALRAGGEFSEIWQPAPGWVAAAAPLPGGEPDGELFRRHQLAFAEGREAITAGGQPAAEAARAAELAATRPEALGSLAGDFGFIHFQPGGRATVVRSCGGRVPFLVRAAPEYTVIATRHGDLIRYLPDEPKVDLMPFAVWAAGWAHFPDRRSYLKGVSVLRPGGFARLTPHRPPTFGSYWDPRPDRLRRPSAGVEQEHTERLRALLLGNLDRDLHPEAGNLLMLSGGVDSSCLAALAAGNSGRDVWTLSVLPEREDSLEREMRYITPLVERYGLDRRWVVRARPETYVEMLRETPPGVFPPVPPALAMLPRVCAEAPVRVLFGGEQADPICGSAFTLPDWCVHTSLMHLLRQVRRLPFDRRTLLTWFRHRARRLMRRAYTFFSPAMDDYVRAEIREEYREWFWRWRREAGAERHPLESLALMVEWDGWLCMNWEMASACGLRRSHPFWTREMLELAFSCHPAELIGPGTKKLLRTALHDDVPALNLYRQDKGAWGGYLRDAELPWNERLQGSIARIVRNEWVPTPPASLPRQVVYALTRATAFEEGMAARRREAPAPAWKAGSPEPAHGFMAPPPAR